MWALSLRSRVTFIGSDTHPLCSRLFPWCTSWHVWSARWQEGTWPRRILHCENDYAGSPPAPAIQDTESDRWSADILSNFVKILRKSDYTCVYTNKLLIKIFYVTDRWPCTFILAPLERAHVQATPENQLKYLKSFLCHCDHRGIDCKIALDPFLLSPASASALIWERTNAEMSQNEDCRAHYS